MTYLLALYFRWKHRAWSWGLCMHHARREREDVEPINWNAVTAGLGVCFVALFVWGVWK
jgi:hypothetical protein